VFNVFTQKDANGNVISITDFTNNLRRNGITFTNSGYTLVESTSRILVQPTNINGLTYLTTYGGTQTEIEYKETISPSYTLSEELINQIAEDKALLNTILEKHLEVSISVVQNAINKNIYDNFYSYLNDTGITTDSKAVNEIFKNVIKELDGFDFENESFQALNYISEIAKTVFELDSLTYTQDILLHSLNYLLYYNEETNYSGDLYEYYLVDEENSYRIDSSNIVILNPVSGFLWEMLQSECTLSQLVKAVTENFRVDEVTAESDIKEFLQMLKESNMLE
jgi:hypothetical protein